MNAFTSGIFALSTFITLSGTTLASESDQQSEIERGQYLTTILGCGGCHTEGALMGRQSGPWLAGSKIGIAYAEDELGETSAVVFPSNLTSDVETGLGLLSKQQIATLLRSGQRHTGEPVNAVMPWSNYALLNNEDIDAIASFIKSLPAVHNQIPAHLEQGQPLTEPYIRFGIYLFLPENSSTEPEPAPKPTQHSCEDVIC